MLPDDIKKLIEETPRKTRLNVKSPQLEQALQEKRIFDIEVRKAGPTSLMTEWKYRSPPMSGDDWKKIKTELLEMLGYVQTMGMVQEYNLEDIKLLMEAATKHLLWKSDIQFETEELELTNVLSKQLKKPFIAPIKEPHWVLKEWDELMTFMLCGRHLERKAYSLESWQTEDANLPRSFH